MDKVKDKIQENRNKEELNLVAKELYKTLGFCNGFLGKDPNEFLMTNIWQEDSFSDEMKVELREAFLNEYSLGKELSNEA